MTRNIMFTALIAIFYYMAFSQSVSISPTNVKYGGTATLTWSGFSGNVNLLFYQGSTYITNANTGVAGSGTQTLNFTNGSIPGYSFVAGPYHVVAQLVSNTAISATSNDVFLSIPSVSISPSTVNYGGTATLSWSGFASNVNLLFYQGSTYITNANTGVAGSGTQTLNFTNGSIPGYTFVAGPYHVVAQLASNTAISATSNDVVLSMPSVSISPTSVSYGGSATLTWSGFSGNVNLLFYQGSTYITNANTGVAGSGTQTLNFTNGSIPGYTFVAGPYHVVAQLASNTAISATSNDVVLSIALASISGGVRNANTKSPIGGATVNLVKGDRIKYTTTSAANGTYSISNVIPGTYTLTGIMTGYYIWTHDTTLNSGVVLTGQNIAMSPVLPINKVLGIDVSDNQGSINWHQIKNTGITFAYIKSTQGTGSPSVVTYFQSNIDTASKCIPVVGAYHFADPQINTNAVSEAQYFLSVSKNYIKNGYLPPALDMEDDRTSTYQSLPSTMNPTVLSAWIQQWDSVVKYQTGIDPILYCQKSIAARIWTSLYDKMKIWIAAPSDSIGKPNNSTWGNGQWPWVFHQYDSLIMSGCSSYIDQDVFNGTIDQFNSFIQLPTPTFVFAPDISAESNKIKIYQENRNGVSNLFYQIPVECSANIIIYNIAGRRIQNIMLGMQKPGEYILQPSLFSTSGIYIAKIFSNNMSAVSTIKIIRKG